MSPVQKWLTLGHAEVVLTDMSPSKWEFIQNYLVPMAKKMGYKPFYPEYKTKREYSRTRGGFLEDDDNDGDDEGSEQ